MVNFLTIISPKVVNFYVSEYINQLTKLSETITYRIKDYVVYT